MEKRALLNFDDWEGKKSYPVLIVNETQLRYSIKCLSDNPSGKRGEVIEVSKWRVTETEFHIANYMETVRLDK